MMNPFLKYDRCRGLRLWRWGRLNVELWYCPAGYEIVPHSHPKEDIELMPVFGWCTFHRQDPQVVRFLDSVKGILGEPSPLLSHAQSVLCSPRRWFRRHSVPAGWVHWFKVGRKVPLIFLNFARWKPGVPITSASEDFVVAAP